MSSRVQLLACLQGLERFLIKAVMDFLMRKRIVTATEALELGLVHEVVPAGELMDRALDLAGSMILP